jgi:toxin ParE1/3/4
VGRKVVLRPSAAADLKSIFLYLAGQAGLETAIAHDERLREACWKLGDFPERGTPREALGTGIRSIPVQRRTTIYYFGDGHTVSIVRILGAGLDAAREFGAG